MDNRIEKMHIIFKEFGKFFEIFEKNYVGYEKFIFADRVKIMLMMIKGANEYFKEHNYSGNEFFTFVNAWFGINYETESSIKLWWITKNGETLYIYRIIKLENELRTFLTTVNSVVQCKDICSECLTPNFTSKTKCNCGNLLGTFDVTYTTEEVVDVA